MKAVTCGYIKHLQLIAKGQLVALNILNQLVLMCGAPRPRYTSPERQSEIYTKLRQLEEDFIAALESAGAITFKRRGAITSRFAVIQVEMMQAY